MSALQAAQTVMMIRPVDFSFNWETAPSNAFQNQQHGLDAATIRNNAQKEFEDFVQLLKGHQVNVIVFNDTVEPATPDSIFPNNWISLDQHDRINIYPMHAENRRLEKRQDIVDFFRQHYAVKQVNDFSAYEQENKFLEGTGSMVIDYVHDIMYACLSPRTHADVVEDFCSKMHYTPVTFTSVDEHGKEIYHTNVMMCIGTGYVVICLDSIRDISERNHVIGSFKETGHEIIDIDYAQMNQFAGNMLEVCNPAGEHFLVMSKRAKDSLNTHQLNHIQKHAKILSPDVNTIETIGGGGVRCMMAEVFLSDQH